MMTLLEQFATSHHLVRKREQLRAADGIGKAVAGEPFIPGRFGEVYVWDAHHLGLLIFGSHLKRGQWVRARRRGLAVGMVVEQNGDQEGVLRFDPAIPAQVTVALDLVRPSRRKSPVAEAPELAVATG